MKLRMIKEEVFKRLSEGKPEVLHKNRGYGVIFVQCHGVTFAIPLRSNMNHSHGLKTILYKNSWNGVDYSKALLINPDDLKDEAFKPRNDVEYEKIKKNKDKIQTEFEEYLCGYVEHVKSGKEHLPVKYKYSTLQYFNEELGLE